MSSTARVAIAITCTDGHHDEPLHLFTFERETGSAEWAEVFLTFSRPGLARKRKVTAGVELGPGDRPDESWEEAERRGSVGRLRYRLACADQNLGCGRGVAIRHERLTPILGQLAEAGVSELSLSALASIMDRT